VIQDFRDSSAAANEWLQVAPAQATLFHCKPYGLDGIWWFDSMVFFLPRISEGHEDFEPVTVGGVRLGVDQSIDEFHCLSIIPLGLYWFDAHC